MVAYQNTQSNPPLSYDKGGSLRPEDPTYIRRQADYDLYQGIKAGDYCYVLASRQMGKSSLLLRTMKRLEAEGFACANIDMSGILDYAMTAEKWYISLIESIVSRLPFKKEINVTYWWREHSKQFNNVSLFEKFIEEVLLKYVNQPKIIIFIDEIDGVRNLKFTVDKFFAAISACYNNHADRPEDRRLIFVFLGAAAPSDLIAEKHGTQFNIYKRIKLTGFNWHEAQELGKKLKRCSNSQEIMKKIFYWTGGQPFLTQKVCDLVAEQGKNCSPSSVDELVKKHIIENWEVNDEREHLETIRHRLRHSDKDRFKLLTLYLKILQGEEIDDTNESEHLELRLTGLVMNKSGKLKVYNPIYAAVFDEKWVRQEQKTLRPQSPDLIVVDYEQTLRDRLLYWTKQESPEDSLDRFRQMFIEGKKSPDREIAEALSQMSSELSHNQSKFNWLINNFCYIFINRFRRESHQAMIVELMDSFKHLSPNAIDSLEKLMYGFTESEQYRQLQEKLESEIQRERNKREKPPLRKFIERYPFVHAHYLRQENSFFQDPQKIKRQQDEKQQEFARDLSLYGNYIARQQSLMTQDLIIEPQKNPTMLDDWELKKALLEFGGEVKDNYTYKDLARRFWNQNQRVRSDRKLIQNLCEYLVAAVDDGKYNLNRQLEEHFRNNFPQIKSKKLDDFLHPICLDLLNFFGVDNSHNQKVLIFTNRMATLGTVKTIALLLKLLLISRKIQPDLEERFAILFEHNESEAMDKDFWLVNSLENLNIALSVNFCDVNLSFLQDLR